MFAVIADMLKPDTEPQVVGKQWTTGELLARIAQLEQAMHDVVFRDRNTNRAGDLPPGMAVFETRRDYTGKVIHAGVGDPDPRNYGDPSQYQGPPRGIRR